MPRRDFPLTQTPRLRERALAWSQDRPEPAPTRPAATVMFVRDGDQGVEVFMLKRVPTMAFAPSMHVFPGGGVDPRDAAATLPWAGPPAHEWARRLGADEGSARMLVAAAAREVFEESGVLLAGATPDEVIADLTDPVWRERRAALVAREMSLADLLTEQGLVLRTDLLRYHAHWVTPEFEPRRYDTRFFAAAVPAGQVADDDTSEAEVVEWVRPDDILRRGSQGEAMLLPPTQVCLEDVAAAGSASAFIAGPGRPGTVMPELVDTPDGVVLRAELP